MPGPFRHYARLLGLALVLVGGGAAFNAAQVRPPTAIAAPAADTEIVALDGYHVSVFARGGANLTKPDPIVVDGNRVFVAYQNATPADGSNPALKSTIVEYNQEGDRLREFSVFGRCDGLRLNPETHLLWATVNEDANPALYTINPENGAEQKYTFSSAAHGGGYDDIAFQHGMAFLAASNPTLNDQGINGDPAIVKVTLSGSTANLTPVLAGNAQAFNPITKSTDMLNLTDPDSLTVTPSGDLVLVDQADSMLVLLRNAGLPGQTVSDVPVGTQLDDTVRASTTAGRLFIVDGKADIIYTMRAQFTAGTVYTEAPSGSGVQGFVGTVDLGSGEITPVAIGFGSPTGLLFAPDDSADASSSPYLPHQ